MRHLYLVVYLSTVVGIFSNRKVLMDNCSFLTNQTYIKGARKNLEVSEATLGQYLSNGFVKLFSKDSDEVLLRIWDLNVNSINPELKEFTNEIL